MFSDIFFTLFPDFLGGVTEKRVSLLPLQGGGERTFFWGKCTGMLRTFFTIDFRFLGNFGPDLEKSLG